MELLPSAFDDDDLGNFSISPFGYSLLPIEQGELKIHSL